MYNCAINKVKGPGERTIFLLSEYLPFQKYIEENILEIGMRIIRVYEFVEVSPGGIIVFDYHSRVMYPNDLFVLNKKYKDPIVIISIPEIEIDLEDFRKILL